MNLFLLLFAIFYFAEQALSFGLTRLNIRHLDRHKGEPPEYFRDKITPTQYQKSIQYTRDKTQLDLLASLVGIPFFWGLLLGGVFGRVDQCSRQWASGTILPGLLFLAAMGVIFYLLSLPFKLYSTFIIEQRYGFNKMTAKLWLLDLVKGLLITVLLGGTVGAAILWFMNRFVNHPWWLYVWILLAAVQLFLVSLYPVVIVPLFNKLTPMPAGSLQEKIESLARRVQFKLAGVFTMDGSKRSSHSNAFFAGMGKFRRIVLFDTLIQSLDEDELVAVLAHEMGHNVKKHTRTGLILQMIFSLAGLFLLSWLVKHSWFYEAFGFKQASAQAALFVFSTASGAFLFFIEPLFSMLSRRHEYAADRFAAESTGATQPMVRALVKLTRDNLSNLTPHPLYSFFYYSHPTVMERIQALEKIHPAPDPHSKVS
jgi:STE24 endopeptidase